MAYLEVEKLSFSYPDEKNPAISNLSFSVESGEFIVLAGPSGSGKSTLLKHLKKEVRPVGVTTGTVLYEQKPIQELPNLLAAQEIGMVFQNPENQMVMDTVIQEIAFSLENIGCESKVIQKRIAELISFFGFQDLLHQSVNQLSGGQKQIVNLASVLVLKPKLLLLDEPTAQLDPIAAKEFLGLLKRVQEELGITVILSEHRLEEVMSLAERMIFMEQGEIVYQGTTEQVMKSLWQRELLHSYIPQIPKLFLRLGETELPFSVQSAKAKINPDSFKKKSTAPITKHAEPVLQAHDISFQYEKNGTFVLHDLNFTAYKGESLAIVGKNGTGKSTLLSVLAGLEKARRGKVKYEKKEMNKIPFAKRYQEIGYVSQNPYYHFSQDTVWGEVLSRAKQLQLNNPEEAAEKILETFELTALKSRHPHDCSGGEQQLVALAITFLSEPKLLLLDEPTKGLDPLKKERLGQLFQDWQKQGMTLIITTHDIEFAAMYMDRCAMIFDGQVISEGTRAQFFNDNFFYTTTINRLFGRQLPFVFTGKDLEIV